MLTHSWLESTLGPWAADEGSHISHTDKIQRWFVVEMYAVSLRDGPQRPTHHCLHAHSGDNMLSLLVLNQGWLLVTDRMSGSDHIWPLRLGHKNELLLTFSLCLPQDTLWCSVLVVAHSLAQSCLTLRDPMNRSMPGLPVHHQLPEFIQTHVYCVSDAIQPSHCLLSPSPSAFNLS